MASFRVRARLHFPLAAVLAAAEHAAAAAEHRTLYGETTGRPSLWWVKDDGTYLMSNAAFPDGTPPEERAATVVHSAEFGPGTDARSVLGGDDFAESLPLFEPESSILEMLRAAAEDGARYVVIEVHADGDRYRLTTR